MPPRNPNKPKITPEIKIELIKRVAELKLEGKSNKFIADALGICWVSVDNYWKIHLKENSQIDLDELLLDRQQVTERLVAKAVREHYEGKVPIKDVETAMNLADRYNGLAFKIMSGANQEIPQLLNIRVQNVDVELPPSGEKVIEQVLDTVQ
jgi:predicted transcriptional regulator